MYYLYLLRLVCFLPCQVSSVVLDKNEIRTFTMYYYYYTLLFLSLYFHFIRKLSFCQELPPPLPLPGEGRLFSGNKLWEYVWDLNLSHRKIVPVGNGLWNEIVYTEETHKKMRNSRKTQKNCFWKSERNNKRRLPKVFFVKSLWCYVIIYLY